MEERVVEKYVGNWHQRKMWRVTKNMTKERASAVVLDGEISKLC